MFIYFNNYSSTPEKTIEKFESACNNQDYNKIIDCLEPDTANGIRAGLKLLTGFTGVDFQSIIDMFPFLGDITKAINAEEMYILDFEIVEKNIVDDTAYLVVKENNSGEILEIVLKKINRKWYISII